MPGELRPAVRVAEPRGRGRGDRRDEPALRELARPVAERAGREGPLRDDDARVLGRLGELRLDDRGEREVAERAVRRPSARSRARSRRAAAGPKDRARTAASRATRSASSRARSSRGARSRRSARTAARSAERSRGSTAPPRLPGVHTPSLSLEHVLGRTEACSEGEAAVCAGQPRGGITRRAAATSRTPRPARASWPRSARRGGRSSARCRNPARRARAARRGRRLAQLRVERHRAEQRRRRAASASASPPPDAEDLGAHVLDHAEQRACSSSAPSSAARTATSCASGCGVVTTTASARGSSWPSEIETSPVPGGMSTSEHVQLAPVDVREELLERAVQHRAAPHDGRVVVEEEADRHQLQVVASPAARSSGRRPPGRCGSPSMCGIEWP